MLTCCPISKSSWQQNFNFDFPTKNPTLDALPHKSAVIAVPQRAGVIPSNSAVNSTSHRVALGDFFLENNSMNKKNIFETNYSKMFLSTFEKHGHPRVICCFFVSKRGRTKNNGEKLREASVQESKERRMASLKDPTVGCLRNRFLFHRKNGGTLGMVP